MVNIHLSLDAHNASAMAEIILKKPQNAYLHLSKHWNIIRFRATAETLYVHLPVVRIAKRKISFYVHFNTLINSQVSRPSNEGGEILKQQGCPHFLHINICV
jgi:hypothetical protein